MISGVKLKMRAIILISLLFSFITCGAAIVNNLTCYKCLVESNDLCTEKDLLPCANDQAYDVCVTIIRKTAKDGFHIEKKCGLGPCSLNRKGIDILGFDSCDRSQNEFECLSCCNTNGCNKDDSQTVRASLIFVLFSSLLISRL